MRKTKLTVGEYYHVFNRGVDKRVIFNSPKDYQRFLYSLFLFNSKENLRIDNVTKYKNNPEKIFSLPRSECLVSIHAYCLMPNHFHILLSENIENGISLFMQKLSTAYTMYFNIKNDRSGSLFQGTYKSVHIESDEQLCYLFAYIHANPFAIFTKDDSIKIKNIEKVLDYNYSSIKDYADKLRPEQSILNFSFFKERLGTTKKDLTDQLKTWLVYHADNQT